LKEYSKYIDKFQNSRGNQQKKINKILDRMDNEHKDLKNDYNIYVEQEEVKKKLNKMQEEINLIEKTIYQTTNNICSLLKNEKYIELNDDKYVLTEKGKACSNINEINNMVFTNVFIKTNKFEKYTDIEIISGLSFLTDVKTSIETKTSVANYLNRNIEEIVKLIDFELNGYMIIEGNYNIYNSGVDYEEKNYDVPNMIEGWINCESEEDCKKYLKEIINKHYEVMTGEFVKVLLKLCAVNKEILNMCLNMNYIELANKMQNIESKILKYVVTPQSLYL
jgi:hypothetical protein